MSKGRKCEKNTVDDDAECIECHIDPKDKTPDTVKRSAHAVMTTDELVYCQSCVKSRIAEALIEELFLSLGWGVFRYGIENNIPGVMNLLKDVRDDVAGYIKRMPDFIVQDKDGNVYFIEVKYRENGEFTIGDLPDDYPYNNSYIVVLSKQHIKCVTIPELRAGKKVTPTSINFLRDRREFHLDQENITNYCDFAVKFFEKV